MGSTALEQSSQRDIIKNGNPTDLSTSVLSLLSLSRGRVTLASVKTLSTLVVITFRLSTPRVLDTAAREAVLQLSAQSVIILFATERHLGVDTSR